MLPPDALERHFEPASVVGMVRRGHPYDFAETYRAMQALYGYGAWYVNLGLHEGDEPGRRLTFRVADALALGEGERLVEVGSGLGQAAVDLARRHGLAAVDGVNVNRRQVAFANALAADEGLADRVRHRVADACVALAALPAGSVHGVLALECVGHFADPDAFLRGAAHALAPGRRVAFCLNVAPDGLGVIERAVARATFGFVPTAATTWRARLVAAGFVDVREEDLTAAVTGALVPLLERRLAHPTPEVRALGASTRAVTRLLLRAAGPAVRDGRLRYALISAARGPA